MLLVSYNKNKKRNQFFLLKVQFDLQFKIYLCDVNINYAIKSIHKEILFIGTNGALSLE